MPAKAPAGAATSRKRKSGMVVPHTARWYQRLGAWVVYALVRLVASTLRFRWRDESGFFEAPPAGPAIYCVWHNRLALCMPAYRRFVRGRSRAVGLAALVSASKDGGFLAAILECFHVQPVRGSSSRRGPQALLELTTWSERDYDLAITPDGPRGPCYKVQEGVMSLAQITGLPIVPFSCRVRWKMTVRSWDRFQIPLPFSKCDMVFGRPLRVSRETTEGERAQLRDELEQRLKEMSGD